MTPKPDRMLDAFAFVARRDGLTAAIRVGSDHAGI